MKKFVVISVMLFSMLAFSQAKPATPQPKKALKAKVFKTTSGNSVSLSWVAPTTGVVTGYNIYRGTTAGGEGTTPLNSTPVTVTTYVDSAVSAGTTYFYVAETYCSNCNPTLSVPSNEVSATIPNSQPNPPTGLTVGTVAGNKVPLHWNAPAAQAGVQVMNYAIFDCFNPNCPKPPLVWTVSTTSILINCPHPSKTCYFEVAANDVVNGKKVRSPMSNIVKAVAN